LQGIKQKLVKALHEIVALLVEAVDVVFDLGDGLGRGFGVAGLVFLVPEIEVGPVQAEGQRIRRILFRKRRRSGMPARCGVILRGGQAVRCNLEGK